MFCTNCGKRLSTDLKFCPKCGGKISDKKPSDPNNASGPPRHRGVKILLIFVAIFAILIIVPAIAYIFSAASLQIYKHPTVGFSINHPRYLTLETPALPANAKCKAAAPCLVAFKDPNFDNYIVNQIIALSATDAGVKKEAFLSGATGGFQADADTGLATVIAVGNKKIYKYENNSAQAANTIAIFSKLIDSDPASEQTMYAFTSGDSIVIILVRKPPAGAPTDYNGYLNINSLIIP